jgi:pimeloyl-ACP methyl ester carboxylesterase
MEKTYLWTQLKARFCLGKANKLGHFNWMFLPGGPGMGSESLTELVELLDLPGNSWFLDFPGDGSNTLEDDETYFPQWREALVEATRAFDNVILVAHSTGGMYALATPELQRTLTGIVLMNSAPDASWQGPFQEYVKNNPISEMEKCEKAYIANPNNKTLKDLTVASAPYVFHPTCPKEKRDFLKHLPYNHRSCAWSGEHFDQTYKAKWFPKHIPALIFSGDHDVITPLANFAAIQGEDYPYVIQKMISKAGHFPWIDNPQEIRRAFEEYVHFLGRLIRMST